MEIKKFKFSQFSSEDVIHPVIEDNNLGGLTDSEEIIQENQFQVNDELLELEANNENKISHLIMTEQELQDKLSKVYQEGLEQAEANFNQQLKEYKNSIYQFSEEISQKIQELISSIEQQKITYHQELAEIIKKIVDKICLQQIDTNQYLEQLLKQILTSLYDITSIDLEINPNSKDIILALLGKLNYSSLDFNLIENLALDKFDIVIHHNGGLITSKYQDRLQEIHNIIDNLFIKP